MNRVQALWNTSVGKKAVMAVTGIIMVAYLITHVLANLLVFQGPDKINAYSGSCTAPAGRSGPRGWSCSSALVLHIIAAVQLTGRRRAARPIGYAAGRDPQVSTIASRTIRWGGALILVFLVYHILHFTAGHGAPGLRRGRSLPQRGDRVRQSAGGGVLRARHGRRGPAPLPRHLEQRAEPGPERAVAPSAPAPAGAGAGGAGLGSGSRSFRSRSTRG